MKRKLLELLGWIGVLEILTTFALVSFELIKVGVLFQVLNLTGAIAIMAHSIYRKDYQPMVINIVIALIASVALMRDLFV